MTPPAGGPAEIANLSHVTEVLALAQQHEEQAIQLAESMDPASVAMSAHHFTVAEGLRGRARFAR
ncbi:hypothetical protein OMP43_21790 [Sphingomonas sp. CBMAI 2297]|uniref:hypothetical protein n=1 Tax=Sphingomonas sp. CBMAI 2297 TaxID=2991720 RepID=UPI002454BD3B|nr:hypothetical protein [Sphingomonas sp. CBMAI 2297]MDH4746663.1 hypothetical protein [Sphingomonas sp. CBMAI 2297]